MIQVSLPEMSPLVPLSTSVPLLFLCCAFNIEYVTLIFLIFYEALFNALFSFSLLESLILQDLVNASDGSFSGDRIHFLGSAIKELLNDGVKVWCREDQEMF